MFLQRSRRALRIATPSSFRICAACQRCNSSLSSPDSNHDRQASKPKPKVIFSGIQPTGIPHLGNYLGALQQWVKLQDEASEEDKLFFSIVDLHAITVKQDPWQLAEWRREMLASLLAVGLDPDRCTIFAQGDVPQHAELMWLLSCNASMGYLGRMTQWKSKLALPSDASPLDPSPSNKAALKLGLFSYPVLQAADILLYRTTHVPVGEDQAQHLEFARELAVGFNHVYPSEDGVQLLTPPETILSPAKRVMSLTNPSKKMSKSDTDVKSRILITDTRGEIRRKFRSALTDSIRGVSYDPETRPGVSNLIDIMYHMDESVAASPEELAEDMKGLSMRALKEKVADTVEWRIRPVRERYKEVMEKGDGYVRGLAIYGAARADEQARDTLQRIKEGMGLSWRHGVEPAQQKGREDEVAGDGRSFV